jgi:hypothetical protein
MMKHVAGRFDAGPAGGNIPNPFHWSILRMAASSPARVSFGPASVAALVNSRPEPQP